MSIHEHEKSFGDYVDSQREQAAAFNEGKKEAVTRNTAVLQTALEEISTHAESALTADLPAGGEMDVQGAFEQIRDIAAAALSEHDGQPESASGVSSEKTLEEP